MKKEENRISRDELFMGIVHLLTLRATCLRRQVGCVVVRDNRVVITAYNGPPSGHPHCLEGGCDLSQKCVRAIHAEANAIAFAARHGIPLEGCVMYIAATPCKKCAELIIQAGIREIVFSDTRIHDQEGVDLLNLSDIKLTVYEKPI